MTAAKREVLLPSPRHSSVSTFIRQAVKRERDWAMQW